MWRCVPTARRGVGKIVMLVAMVSPLLMGASEAPQSELPLKVRPQTQAGASPAITQVPKHLKPVQPDTVRRMAAAGVAARAPLHIRVFKEESELEVWKARADGTYAHIKTYPICTFSGGLGPKQRYADYQSPEGFYTVTANLMKPDSGYHLAFNVGYPNALDRSLGRTGNLIMVHGKCKSVGCFAMGDHLIEDIYALAREALAGGQAGIPVHSFPFRMTAEAMIAHVAHPHAASWGPLRQAYRSFETTRRVPQVAVCEKRYVVNPVWFDQTPKAVEPTAACPAHIEASSPPALDEAAVAAEPPRAVAEGPKLRTAASIANWAQVRARMIVLAAEARRVKREKFQQTLAAREAADTNATRSNLGAN